MRRYRIGRADTNEIVLLDPTVSREHAELTKLSHGHFSLRDLGSTYGTSARLGSDWHLITRENVSYETPIRIGEFETTVARLLREVDPIAVYMDSPAAPPWASSDPRLSPDERAQHPETTHVGWGPTSSQCATPVPPPQPHAIAASPIPISEAKRGRALPLVGAGAVLIAGLMIVAAVLIVAD